MLCCRVWNLSMACPTVPSPCACTHRLSLLHFKFRCLLHCSRHRQRPQQAECSNEVATAPLHPSDALVGHPREQWQNEQHLFTTLALQCGSPEGSRTHLLEHTIHPAHVWLLSGTSAHFATDLSTSQPRAQTLSRCCAGCMDWEHCAAYT